VNSRSNHPSVGAAARQLAAQALTVVIDQKRSLTDRLDQELATLADSRDRALVRRLCNNVLRNLPRLEWRLQQLLNKPLTRKARCVHFLLLSAIDELMDQREPAPAVIHASVAATRLLGQSQLSGLVNAVLRNHQRRAEQLDERQPETASLMFGYPDWLIDSIRGDWPDDWKNILIQGNQPPPVWLRVNPRKTSVQQMIEALEKQPLECTHVDKHALKLDRSVSISQLPGFTEGWCSIQDAGAQRCAALLDLEPGLRVLDACAAPGGKTAHVLELETVKLSAIEIDPKRAMRIGQNLSRLDLQADLHIADATKTDQWWDGEPFDRILIDAPCSATGVMRRHPDIRWLRQPADIQANVVLQRALLNSLWPLLRPGGLLVYASCSILDAENCAQARWFLDNQPDAEAVPIDHKAYSAVAMPTGIQILPGSLDRDGFYYAVFRRLQPD